ncbi:hypothetical protein SAMN06297422_11647 [Lachnospiraceae bacterium]|nr:hypothetical protein SAMN06297422_11647 [Lachnospiraceae bacterium]
MLDIFSIYFNIDMEWRNLDYYLGKRMSELVSIRNEYITNSYISEFESKYVIPDMKSSRDGYEDPGPDYVYRINLEELITLIKVMEYKETCFQRYLNRLSRDEEMAPIINAMIRHEIEVHHRISYEEIIALDKDEDIATELEHMIENKEIRMVPLAKNTKKNPYAEHYFPTVSYPKLKWEIIN